MCPKFMNASKQPISRAVAFLLEKASCYIIKNIIPCLLHKVMEDTLYVHGDSEGTLHVNSLFRKTLFLTLLATIPTV